MVNFVKIELKGFKSFADKVEIPFQEGITAIIGPNGCGKSNVAEAIKWALGEHRAKQLRGKSMVDVIFAGTEKRKSMSYAEVSITFNNQDRRLFPTIAFDEVVFTRKLDRSGDSEYFINHNKVRMKDIINVIHDTGIGKDGYSIIGQGRVSEILSAKPEERRNIFEEAAGISKFRAQRVEAERNLEKTSLNLQTANEIISEIERSIGPLKKQAETANRYTELKEDLKNKEINLYLYNYEHNQEIKQAIYDKLEKINKDLETAQQTYRESTKKYELLMIESQSIDRELQEKNNEALALTAASGESQLVKQKIEFTSNEIQRINDELLEIDNQLDSTIKMLTQVSDNKELSFNEQLKIGKSLEITKKRFEELSNQKKNVDILNLSYTEALEELNSLNNNMANFVKEKGMIENRIESLTSLINDKSLAFNDAKTNLAIYESLFEKNDNKLKELVSEYNELLSNRKDSEDSLNGYNNSIQMLNSQITSEKSKLELLVQIRNNYSTYQEAIKLLMQDAKTNPVISQKILGVLANIINVPKEFEAAIEYSLGGALQSIVVEDERDASDLITYLKQKKYGRVTFRPLTSSKPAVLGNEYLGVLDEPGCFGIASDLIKYDKKYVGVIKSLLGATVVVNNIDNATRIYKKYNQGFRIVTLDGDIFTRVGEITGGSQKNNVTKFLSQEQDIDSKKTLIAKLEKNVSTFISQRDNLANELEEIKNQLENHLQEINELNYEVKLTKEKYQIAQTTFESLQVELENHNEQLNVAKNDLTNIDEQLKRVNDLEEVVNKKKNDIASTKEISNSDKSESNKEYDELISLITQLNVQLTSEKAKYQQAETDLFRLNTEKGDLEDNKLELISQLKKNQDALKQIQDSIKTDFSKEDQEKISELKKLIEEYSIRKNTISDEINKTDSDKQKSNDEIIQLTGKKVRNESMLENIDIEIRNLQAHVLEEYNVTYSTATSYRDPEFNKDLAVHDIATLKKDIEKLGPVNLLAVETLKESEARLEEQTKQRDDIQKAYNDIVEIINVLTGEMQDKFLTAFEKINTNFKEVFAQLFGGGNGDLRLDTSETDDVLECGIEIFAQPPGKSKIKNISLLSGGEQALTAIAILFSILKLKPMPFCVLDEIEAALDDSNVDLFAKFLKKFSDYTQFIVITHRKPTMRHADSIFGVTMQEKGVTKIVSIEFEEAQKYAK